MPRKISRSLCIKAGCYEESLHKRLCREHFRQAHPEDQVIEFSFRWQTVETFEGVIRATTREEAQRLVNKGLVHGTKTAFNPKPICVELLGWNEC